MPPPWRAAPSPPPRGRSRNRCRHSPTRNGGPIRHPGRPLPSRWHRRSAAASTSSTLVAAAIAAVVAATVVSRLWQAGTVWATAMTPVIVTVVKEALDRPAKRVSSIAARAAPAAGARHAGRGRAAARGLRAAAAGLGPDPGLTEMRVYRRERATGRRWKLAVATGLLAFVIGVAVLTLPELVAGRSVVSGTHHTTIFGGHRSRRPRRRRRRPTRRRRRPRDQSTSTDTQPQDTTTQPDTTTTAPNGRRRRRPRRRRSHADAAVRHDRRPAARADAAAGADPAAADDAVEAPTACAAGRPWGRRGA